MGSMSASDAAPLPRLGEVFFDVRGSSRSMRLSWYANTGIAVFSIWQGGTCTGTFRLPLDELSRLVESLSRGLADGPVQATGDQGATDPIALGGQRTRLAIGPGPLEAFTGAMNVLTDEQAAAYGVPRPPQPGPAQNGGGYAAAWPANGFAPVANGYGEDGNGYGPGANGFGQGVNGFAPNAANGFGEGVNGFAPTAANGFGQPNGYAQDANGSGPTAAVGYGQPNGFGQANGFGPGVDGPQSDNADYVTDPSGYGQIPPFAAGQTGGPPVYPGQPDSLGDRKSTRLNSSHERRSRMPSSA